MKLCFDIGNSQIVLGITENKKIISTFRFATDANLSSDEYYQRFKPVIPDGDIDGIAVSNVVPAFDRIMNTMCSKYFHQKPFFVAPGIKSSIKLKIEEPKSLGADLLCDAVGAYNRHNGPVFICDLGTASKIIVVSEKGEYLGGMIAPGMEGSLNSLINNAAKLSHTALDVPPHVVSNNTTTCIQSGMLYGTVAMLEGWIAKAVKELGYKDYHVVLTGGLSILINDILDIPHTYEPNILLEGLIHLYYKNRG